MCVCECILLINFLFVCVCAVENRWKNRVLPRNQAIVV